MPQISVDIQPGVLNDFTLLGGAENRVTLSVVQLGATYAIKAVVTDDSPRSRIAYNPLFPKTENDQIETYLEYRPEEFTGGSEFQLHTGTFALTSYGATTEESYIDAFHTVNPVHAGLRTRARSQDGQDEQLISNTDVTQGGTGVKFAIRQRYELTQQLTKVWRPDETAEPDFQTTQDLSTRTFTGDKHTGFVLRRPGTYYITALSFGTDGDSAPTDATPAQAFSAASQAIVDNATSAGNGGSHSDLTYESANARLVFKGGTDSASDGRFFALNTLDGLDLNGRTNFEIYVECELRQDDFQLFPIGSGDTSDALNINMTVGRYRPNAGRSILEWVDSNVSGLASDGTQDIPREVRMSQRFRREGDTLFFKAWRTSDAEPTGWQLQTTHAVPAGHNQIGVGNVKNHDVYVYSIGVGINGDPAPADGGAVSAPQNLSGEQDGTSIIWTATTP